MVGGLFRRCKIKLKQFSLGIETFLCPKLGEDKKRSSLGFRPVLCPESGEDRKKKNDRSLPRLRSLFCDRFFLNSRVKVVIFLLPMPMGGKAVFTFSAKIGLKSTKNWVFCVLCMLMDGL